MYAVPDVEEVVAVAKSLGIHLGPDEAVLYRKHLLEQLDALDTFVQARIEEQAPPMCSAAGRAGSQDQVRTRSTPGCGSARFPERREVCWPARRSVSRTTLPLPVCR